MKLKHLVFFLFASALLFSACEKDKEEIDTVWKEANEAAFAKTAASSGYTKLESQSKNGSIAYKVLKAGSGTESPLFSDKVKVKYVGWYKRFDWTKGDTYVDESNGNFITNKIEFDKSLEIPATFSVSNVVDGFSTALQYMVVGDKWEVWIPWKLGYGSSGYSGSSQTIEGYTTLVFEVELEEIIKE
ncbi:MAG: FKBP-type peptidyl-prolyl cis-trans isomerase [Dysgonamonadaceae bacterium]|jgi:peptidylprolyl isomerase/FKBP-type peptidyl-prolyl cis-trans isomerase FklB|nr:FKBP-type peptidyl-prolyl cis-trans isomerase [Dysgonamonadaceae bacterium]